MVIGSLLWDERRQGNVTNHSPRSPRSALGVGQMSHPEFLETEADYENAPEGTIVACEDSSPWYKSGPEWSSVDFCGIKDNKGMSRARRLVLRWGNE